MPGRTSLVPRTRISSYLTTSSNVIPLHGHIQRRYISTSRASARSATAPVLLAVVSRTSLRTREPEDAKELRHHAKDGKGFLNPWDSFRPVPLSSILRIELLRRITGKSKPPDTTPPTVLARKPAFLDTRETSQLRATWLGHACYYVEFPGGLRILFDPVLEHRCSPISWLGPKRYTDIPCTIDDIPFIDAVVISHNHYDHLSLPSITRIRERHPNAHFFAPLGNKKWFDGCGIENMTELDWWQSRTFSLTQEQVRSGESHCVEETNASQPDSSQISATISCLPCQHNSARTPFDKTQSLWASWSIESGGKKVWFGGDTGYRSVPDHVPEDADDYDPKYNIPNCPAFKQIGELRGPFDLGLIPIGAYSPRFTMSPYHANPFDSVNIFQDTACKRAMGIHWGAWILTDEAVLEPPKLLKKALAAKGFAEEGVFDTCEIGESREFPDE